MARADDPHIRPHDQPAVGSVNPVAAKQKPSIVVDFDAAPWVKLMLGNQHHVLRENITRIINSLSLPDDEVTQYRVVVTASPIPRLDIVHNKHEHSGSIDDEKSGVAGVRKVLTAGLGPQVPTITLSLGALLFTHDEDELAGGLAHEMTHANPNQRKVRHDSEKVRQFLEQFDEYKKLTPKEQEEMRADLGELERLILATRVDAHGNALPYGYNPWGSYRYMQRVAWVESRNRKTKAMKQFVQDHPHSGLRMMIMKAFIADYGFHIDLSEHTKHTNLFSPQMARIRSRAALCYLPLTSAKAQRALKLALVGGATYTAAAISPQLATTVGDSLSAAAQSFGLNIRSLIDDLGPNDGSKPNGVRQLLSDHGVQLFIGAITTGALLKGVKRYVYRSGLGKHHIGSAWLPEALAMMDDVRDQVKAARLTLQSPVTDVVSLLSLTNDALSALNSYHHPQVQYQLRKFNGLARAKNDGLTIQASLLRQLNTHLDSILDATQRAAVINDAMRALHKLPGFALEDDAIAEALIQLRNRADPTWQNASTAALLNAAHHPTDPDKYVPIEVIYLNRHRRKQMSTSELFDLATATLYSHMRDTAAKIFSQHQKAFVDYILSSDNAVPQNVDQFATMMNYYAEFKSFGPDNIISKFRAHRRFFKDLAQNNNRTMADNAARLSISNKLVSIRYFDRLSGRTRVPRAAKRKLIRDISRSFDSVSALVAWINSELVPRNVEVHDLHDELQRAIVQNPHWIRTEADLNALYDCEALWTDNYSAIETHYVQRGGVDHLVKRHWDTLRRRVNNTILKYRSDTSDIYHEFTLNQLQRLEKMPTTAEGKRALWLTLTSRGVTNTSEKLFSEIYPQWVQDDRTAVERAVLDDGRIWQPEIHATLLQYRIRQSPAYQQLRQLKDPTQRRDALKIIIKDIQQAFLGPGQYYSAALEMLSRDIQSSPEESAVIESAKIYQGGEHSLDLGLRVISAVMTEAEHWPHEDQWAMILFLRGEAPAPARVRGILSAMDPEFLRRSFHAMPSHQAALLLEGFMALPTGLIPQVDVSRGYSKKIVQYLLKDATGTARKVTEEVLTSFMYGLEKTGNQAFRGMVLAYLLSRPIGHKRNIGYVLKDFLEYFGATGVKIGQFLAAAAIFPEEETRILRTLQEHAREPEREAIYEDLRAIGNGQLPAYEIDDLRGAASIKYVLGGKNQQTGAYVALSVLRQEAVAHHNAEFDIAEEMANDLQKRHGAKYAILGAIVRTSRQAVKRELSFVNEVAMAQVANQAYRGKSDKNFRVRTPHQTQLHERLIESQYMRGTSFSDVPAQHKADVAAKILTMESEILFSDDLDIIHFDPDRHGGNYRILTPSGYRKRTRISPIDFGQFQTITRAERDTILDLFAISQMLKVAGVNRWTVQKVAQLLDLNATQTTQLDRQLRTHFSAAAGNRQDVTAYYALLAAVDKTGKTLPISYYDFIRACITTNEYEPYTQQDASPIHKLKTIAEARIKKFAPQARATMTNRDKYNYLKRSATLKLRKATGRQ